MTMYVQLGAIGFRRYERVWLMTTDKLNGYLSDPAKQSAKQRDPSEQGIE